MRSKQLLAVGVCVLVTSGGLWAQPKSAKPKPKPKPAPTLLIQGADETARIEKLLTTTAVTEIKFNQHEFRDVVDSFRETYGLNIYVEWKALEAAGVSKSTPVTLNLRNVTVGRTLDVILSEVSTRAPGADAQIMHIVDNGVLTISTLGSLSRKSITRVYPAADLLCRTRRAFTGGLGYPWRMTSFLPVQEDVDERGSAGGIFDDSLSERGYSAGTEEAAEELMQLTKTTIDRDSWGDPEGGGGGAGFIQVMGTSLVVTQTFKNHEAVAKLLEMLRADREKLRITVGVAIVRIGDADAGLALRKALGKADDVAAALADGEDKGSWTLDRCKVEQTHLGDVIRATHLYARMVRMVPPDANTIILPHTTMYGYEIGVLPKSRDGAKVTMSVACGAGWIGKEDNPAKDTPMANTGVQRRHNTFDFALATAGKARVFSAVPATAKDGGVKVVVWLPKTTK